MPGSDGAGVVADVGPSVKGFKKGDRVAGIFTTDHQAGPIKPEYMGSSLGGATDGVFQEYGVLEERGLVMIPETLDLQQASTLPCAAVTAWNALYGIEGKKLIAGQWVLTQGTGGVSLFAVQVSSILTARLDIGRGMLITHEQFAKAAGARVIATTSTAEKQKQLKQLGADYVLNYKQNPNWGEEAKKISGEGVDHILEVGGPTTVQQALAAVRPEGVISIIGFVGGRTESEPSYLNILQSLCTVRGLLVGSRDQFRDMNACIDANKIKPVIDSKVFELDDLPQAYQYMWDQNHVGKVTFKISQ